MVAWYRAYKIPTIHPDAFSVIANDYTVIENNNTIELSGSSLNFIIINKSGYALPYEYVFTDLMDGGTPLFEYNEGELYLEPNTDTEISFSINSNASISDTDIMLSIWPVLHEYALKERSFSVSANPSILGDINYDGNIDVIDVVLMVNMILGNDDLDLSVSDLNNDGELNVVDIVILVNLIHHLFLAHFY